VSSFLDTAKGLNKLNHGSCQARCFHNYGFTSTICTSRRGLTNGISHPVLKPNTLDGTILLLTFVVVGSDMAQNTKLLWLSATGLTTTFQDPD
jgi:hypothetical protein